MAEGGDDFNIPENADQILFVEDLINYIEVQYPSNFVLEWDPVPFRQYIHNAFNRTIQNAIYFLENALDVDHEHIFAQMQNENSVNSNVYERFAENLAMCYFPEGFDANFFLLYCVNLCRISAYFRLHGVLDAPVLARKHILKFLEHFNMLDGGWDTVRRIAEIYEKMMMDSENIPTPQSPDSDGSESQDLSQSETNSDESNFCSSEEQNISSENEDNLKQHQERACSIKEPLLKKSSQCSSESSNDIDLSSLEEPKSPQEDLSLKSNFKGNKRNNTSESMDRLRAGTSKNESPPEDSSLKINFKGHRPNNTLESMDKVRAGTSKDGSPPEDSSLKINFKGNKHINISESIDRLRAGISKGGKESLILIKNDCRSRMDLAWNDTKNSNFQACIERDKLIDEVAPDDRFCPGSSSSNKDSSFLGKNDCTGKLDCSLNAKENEKSETLNFEEEKIDNSLLDDGLRTEISNTARISPNAAGCKRKHDLSPDEENGANSQPISSDRDNLGNKFEPNKKLVSEIPNFYKISVSSNMKMDYSSSKESNAIAENKLLPDEEKSPELKERRLELEGISCTSSDEEGNPTGDGNL